MDVVAQGLKLVMDWIYSFSGDYGIAIILITLAIRALLIPLNVQQRRQAEKQKEISEDIEKLKIKYKNNSLYYLTSGAFSAAEQLIVNLLLLRKHFAHAAG